MKKILDFMIWGFFMHSIVDKANQWLYFFSVTTMKSVLESTLEFASPWQTTGYLLGQFQRTKLRKTYWKSLVKSQVRLKESQNTI